MKILIADDDVMLADFLEEAVTELGHTVCGVARGVAEAVSLVRAHHPDVAILDMQLTGMELGSDIVDELVASGDLGETGVLYVTGESERVYQQARFGHACLKKPYSLNTLQTALAIVREMAGGSWQFQKLPHGMGLLRPMRSPASTGGRQGGLSAVTVHGRHASVPCSASNQAHHPEIV